MNYHSLSNCTHYIEKRQYTKKIILYKLFTIAAFKLIEYYM